MASPGAFVVLAVSLSFLVVCPPVSAAPPYPEPPAARPTAAAAPALAFDPGLREDTDLLLLPAARRPPPRPTVIAATRSKARPDAIFAVALNPAAMREALPALVRADVVATRPGPRKDAWPDRLIAWEVEVPLFNLAGRAWLQQRPDGADLTLVDGAFAPGLVRFRATRTADGQATIATCELQVEIRSANWIFRKVARHDPWAETAMTAATAWVLARAVSVRAESPAPTAPTPPPRPRAPIVPPIATALDGSGVAAATLAPLRAAGTVATIRRAPGGRLAWASFGLVLPGSPAAVASRLATPENWRVIPGWKSMKRRAAPAPTPGAAPAPTLIEVEDNIAFVNLDATWSVRVGADVRATAVEGDTRGAVFGWQTWPGDQSGSSLAVMSIHPHMDAAGFIVRRLITAEPLLEHAFGVARAYVDGTAVGDALDRSAAAP